MPLKVEDVLIRIELSLNWLSTPMNRDHRSREGRLQDIEAEIARLRRWAVTPQALEFVQRFDDWANNPDLDDSGPRFEAVLEARAGLPRSMTRSERRSLPISTGPVEVDANETP